MAPPEWVSGSIFYQIFPDRFENGDTTNDPVNVQPWGSKPTSWGFQGGDLQGIYNRFDYLLDLGINAIYLNPIFLSTSNHRYNTTDYYKIDPRLGDISDFKKLIDHAHRHGVRVILDGVFNHCGRSFFAFADVLENREHSPYRDWFHILRFPVDAFSLGDAKDYLAWWRIKSLPKFNTSNPDVRRYLFGVARYWIEQGADGWRLDVPNEIDDDEFWAEFRHVVTSINREAYLLGEIWKPEPRWVGEQHFDGLMNYPLRECILNIVDPGGLDIAHCMTMLDTVSHLYPAQYTKAMYNLLGSHDTERALFICSEDKLSLKLAYLLLFAYPGVPAIYYGDEIGLSGGRDPECRAAFPWDETEWDHSLRDYVKNLILHRKRLPALRRGEYRHILSDHIGRCLAFARVFADQSILIAINASNVRRDMVLPVADIGWSDGQILRDVLGAEECRVNGDAVLINLPPMSGVWLA
ncbi:MAG: hypothetical protein A2W33_09930 [Chloroflexi bacterium RBG_16_52_11]|nr:MAG: hypothetical protein A2W33_09930 [Chloroflexi bacterium RBG_16_52_11]